MLPGEEQGFKVVPNSITGLPPLLEKVIGERDRLLAGTALKGESGDQPWLWNTIQRICIGLPTNNTNVLQLKKIKKEKSYSKFRIRK